MSLRNDEAGAELEQRVEELYGRLDADKYFSGLPEGEKDGIVADAAAEIVDRDSYLPRLARSELERNVRNGLSIADPARVGMGISFEPFRLTKEGYEHAKAALIDAGKNIDSETFRATSDYNEEILGRAAFALIGRPYIPQGDERERMLMANPGLLDGFAGAYEKARAVYLEKVPEAANIVVPEEKPRPSMPREAPAEKKGFIARHKKAIGIGIAGLFAAAAGFGIYTVMNNTPKNRFVDSAKAKGVSDADAGKAWDEINASFVKHAGGNVGNMVDETAHRMLDYNLIGKYTPATRAAEENVTLAYKLGLPALSNQEHWALMNATQRESDVMNYNPIVDHSVNATDVSISIPSSAGTYLMAKQLNMIDNSSLDVSRQHPEFLTALNVKNIMNYWCAFKEQYGLGWQEQNLGRKLDPTNKDLLDLLLLQWKIRSSYAPQLGGGDVQFNRDFHWDDSKALKDSYSNGTKVDTNAMRLALAKFFYLEPKITNADNGKVEVGITAATTDLVQSDREYRNTILTGGRKHTPDVGITPGYKGAMDQWFGDRYNNGLPNAYGEYFGCTEQDMADLRAALNNNGEGYKELLQKVLQERVGVDQFLQKHWKYWQLADDIWGITCENYSEWGTIQYSLLRTAGFPTWGLPSSPVPDGTGTEYAISLPPKVAADLKAAFPRISLGTDYSVGVGSCLDGLQADGVRQVWERFGADNAYRMNK